MMAILWIFTTTVLLAIFGVLAHKAAEENYYNNRDRNSKERRS